MAKRFIDAELFDDPWFMDLSLSGKVLWMYCITKCNHAGILELNEKLAQFQTGVKGIGTVIKELGNRLVRVNEQYIFIPKYIEFQYPGFPNSKVRQQASAVEILKKFNLFDNIKQTVSKELTDSYVNDTVNDNDIVNEKKIIGKCLMRTSGVTLNIISQSLMNAKDIMMADPTYYFNTALAWSDSKGEMRVDWIATVANFARKDMRDGKMKIKKKSKIEGQGEQPSKDYGVPSPTAVPMPKSIKDSISKIGKV